MKTTVTLGLLLTWVGCELLATPIPQNQEIQPQPKTPLPADYGTQILLYRQTPKGQALDMLISGDHREPLTDRDWLITPFQLKSFHAGPSNEVQLIGRAPECHYDKPGHRAWDQGPLVLFTPTSNLWAKGEGFLFIETNHLLTISNKVETRVLRSLLKTSMLAAGKTNAPATVEQMLKIFADGPALFDNQSNLIQYFHHVHVVDVQLDMTSDRLSIQFTTNSAIRTILAEGNVLMTTTNKGFATAPRAFYYETNGCDMTELSGGAVWQRGDERAKAEKFLYDSTHHLLTAVGNVRVWWPNVAMPGSAPKTNESVYRELWADYATLQMPPTNGPVEAMHARGNVLIVNQADHSSSTGDQADYTRTNNNFELTGSPVWWNDQMEIKGRTLTAEAADKIYHARGDASLKLKVAGGARANQVLYIAAEEIDEQTNLAVFRGHVKTRLLEDGVLQDTLDSDKLDVELTNNDVKTAVARGHVQGESAPDKFDRIKTIACDILTAHRSPITKLMTDILAENHVVLRQFGTKPGTPRDQLTAGTATAYFSSMTNQIERAVAEENVVIDDVKTNQSLHATGQRVVYTVAKDEVKLTGAPVAGTDQYVVTNADSMIWQPKSNRFRAFGPFFLFPVKVETRQPSP